MITAPPPPPALPDGSYVDVPGARLWTTDTGGRAPVIVLLHSAVCATAHWAYQVAPLREAGFRVVAYDRRGYGRSRACASRSTEARDPSAADFASLLEALGVGAAHVVGIAQGGRVATEVAVARPDLVESLTLVASTGGVRFPASVAGAPPLMPTDFTSYPTWFTELGAPYRSIDPAGTLRWIDLGDNSHPPGLNGPVVKLGTADLAGIGSPLMLLGGDADPFTPPPVLRRMHEVRPDARLEILRECGHSPQWERPDLFNATVADFVRG